MTNEALRSAGLPANIIAKMEAAKAATAEPCPTCGAGRGKFCVDLKGETHAARKALTR